MLTAVSIAGLAEIGIGEIDRDQDLLVHDSALPSLRGIDHATF